MSLGRPLRCTGAVAPPLTRSGKRGPSLSVLVDALHHSYAPPSPGKYAVGGSALKRQADTVEGTVI